MEPPGGSLSLCVTSLPPHAVAKASAAREIVPHPFARFVFMGSLSRVVAGDRNTRPPPCAERSATPVPATAVQEPAASRRDRGGRLPVRTVGVRTGAVRTPSFGGGAPPPCPTFLVTRTGAPCRRRTTDGRLFSSAGGGRLRCLRRRCYRSVMAGDALERTGRSEKSGASTVHPGGNDDRERD
jgi:hypothetical protein